MQPSAPARLVGLARWSSAPSWFRRCPGPRPPPTAARPAWRSPARPTCPQRATSTAGTADTGRTLSVASHRLTVGGRTTVTVVVANRGPQPTKGLQVIVLHDGTHTTDHVVLSGGRGAGVFGGYQDVNGHAGLTWTPPSIAPGKRCTATFTLTGRLRGTGYVTVTTTAVTYDPGTEGVAVRSKPITVR